MAGMMSKLWDDVAGGSPPDKGMKQLRKSGSANNARFPDGMVWPLSFVFSALFIDFQTHGRYMFLSFFVKHIQLWIQETPLYHSPYSKV